MSLTPEQLAFLDRVEVPLEKVFDAWGYRTSQYQELMSERKLWIAYNVTPCRRLGHTLRTRAGHCAQCNPFALKRLKENDEPGEVYVAYSPRLRLVKIGCAQSATYRVHLLNDEQYAMTSDWALKHSTPVASAGRTELAVHSVFSMMAVPKTYLKNGRLTETRETFRVPIKVAIAMVDHLAAESDA